MKHNGVPHSHGIRMYDGQPYGLVDFMACHFRSHLLIAQNHPRAPGHGLLQVMIGQGGVACGAVSYAQDMVCKRIVAQDEVFISGLLGHLHYFGHAVDLGSHNILGSVGQKRRYGKAS